MSTRLNKKKKKLRSSIAVISILFRCSPNFIFLNEFEFRSEKVTTELIFKAELEQKRGAREREIRMSRSRLAKFASLNLASCLPLRKACLAIASPRNLNSPHSFAFFLNA